MVEKNQELRKLYQYSNIVAIIKTRKLRWVGYKARTPENTNTKEGTPSRMPKTYCGLNDHSGKVR